MDEITQPQLPVTGQRTTDEIRANLSKLRQEYATHQFDSYFKYFSDNERIIQSIFIDQKLRFTQPRALNDPLEFNPTLHFENTMAGYRSYELEGVGLPSPERFFRLFIIEALNQYGILSLTKTPDSFDMWSHYSNGHRGFLLEFKDSFWTAPSMMSKSRDIYPAKRVQYVDDYCLNLDSLANENHRIPINILLDELFLKKTSRWSHENEYRMIRPLTDCWDYTPPQSTDYKYADNNLYLFPFEWDCVASVVLGACMSKENKRLIAECCSIHNIHLSQAFIFRDAPGTDGKPCYVLIVPLEEKSWRDTVLSFDRPCCYDTIESASWEVVKINKLSQLPYYDDYMDEVKELYSKLKSI